MKKYYYIYKITFLKGKLKGKYYIGMHIGKNPDLVNDGYFGSGSVCKRYYKKYPPVVGETITKEILEVCESKEQLAECEKKWIGDLWETDDLCVNMKSGGDGGWDFCKGKPMSKEHRRKISEANKGKILPPVSQETRKKISNSVKGRKRKEETKILMSTLAKNRKQTLNHKWINNGVKNKCVKVEHLDQYLSNGWQQGMLTKGRKLKPHTEETRQKMREAWERRKAAKQAA